MASILSIAMSILIVSGIATGLTIFYTDMASNYGVTINENQSLNIINQAQNMSILTGNITTTIQQSGGLIERVFSSVGLIFGVIGQIVLLPVILVSMITDMLSFVPFVPGWFIVLVLGIPTLYIIFKIVGWFTGRET